MSRTISVGELRQNPTAALDAVAEGESFVVTRHRKPIAELRPIRSPRGVSPADFAAVMSRHRVDIGWSAELAEDRESESDDPWDR